jgi:hypothetical protein
MSSLAGTTWNLDNGATFTYNADGTANAGGPNDWYWTETSDGNWLIQTKNPILQENVSEIYYGTHANGAGTGYYINGWNGAKAILQSFTMMKN